ncbi:hypothetical protein AVEN_238981-1 [Araneus ventricosus]|uniref:Uncharacterized protein n=3 Tax=Araneus ventricosus TaxID=182803 RepID=A0A4Y2UYN9_ARAVE|nr:hypothetical protein AVEN_274665-1 [Araneus ventricosus]GBO16637.1 hypothetical protein AVEN_16747-1 [Araneus ventricosus]GBO16649.1 hypothetical protein AVEN_238981-1 [Araneus ventricosus]
MYGENGICGVMYGENGICGVMYGENGICGVMYGENGICGVMYGENGICGVMYGENDDEDITSTDIFKLPRQWTVLFGQWEDGQLRRTERAPFLRKRDIYNGICCRKKNT